jgi:CRP-like cAMP-binding protein
MPRLERNNRTQNSLLGTLPPDVLHALTSASEIVPLDLKRVLHESDEAANHVYFPLSGVISLLTVLDDGNAVEIATVGREGMADIAAYLDLESPARWLVQVPGWAIRLKAKHLRRLAQESPKLTDVMHNYMLAMFVVVSQTAACNRRHPIEERCARWLLMTHDRVETDTFPMTHEFLADMLGVRRPGVSTAMGVLSRAGFMDYHRGKVEILDREGLESATCECYGVLTDQFEKRFPVTSIGEASAFEFGQNGDRVRT